MVQRPSLVESVIGPVVCRFPVRVLDGGAVGRAACVLRGDRGTMELAGRGPDRVSGRVLCLLAEMQCDTRTVGGCTPEAEYGGCAVVGGEESEARFQRRALQSCLLGAGG